MIEKYALALSEKDEDEAPKELSYKLKSFSPRNTKTIILFFTPQYPALTILKTLAFTLKPQHIIGIQAPCVICEDHSTEKGIVACCINDTSFSCDTITAAHANPHEIETTFQPHLKHIIAEKPSLYTFIPSSLDVFNYMRGLELALGKMYHITGVGHTARYAYKQYHLINNTVLEGALNLFIKETDITHTRINGFVPLGKPFTVTKVIPKKGIIMEINGKPAAYIYRHYLEEKYDTFKRTRVFPFYPLGFKDALGQWHLMPVLDILEDDSLYCIGTVKERMTGHVMLLHPHLLHESLSAALAPIRRKKNGLVCMINSNIRRRILRDEAPQEIRLIKSKLGDTFNVFGCYSDYYFIPNKTEMEMELSSGDILLSVWK